MNKQLTYQQIKNIREAYLKDKLSIEKQIIELLVAGFDEPTAEYLVANVIKDYKQELFDEAQEKETNKEHRNIAYYVIIFATASGPLFGVENFVWYLFTSAIAGIAGNYGFKGRPLAGIIGAIVAVISFPLAFKFYLAGRSNYIMIELLLPLMISLIPAYLIQFLISKIAYPEYED
jgi:hypothetical protein